MSQQLPTQTPQTFEDLKQTNEHKAEYWSARDLQPLLGYSQWRRFEDAVKRAMTSCEASGNNQSDHFAGAGKPILFSASAECWAQSVIQYAGGKVKEDVDGLDGGSSKRIPQTFFDPVCTIKRRPKLN